MSLSLIDSFMTGAYTVKRQKPGYYHDGFYQGGGTDEEVKIKGSMQPLSGREIKMVEEGYRLKQLFKFYSDKSLSVIDTKGLKDTEVVMINNERFRVISVERWMGTSLDYFKSILAREPQQ